MFRPCYRARQLAISGLSFRNFNDLAVDIGAGFRVQKPLVLWLFMPRLERFSVESKMGATVLVPRYAADQERVFLGILFTSTGGNDD